MKKKKFNQKYIIPKKTKVKFFVSTFEIVKKYPLFIVRAVIAGADTCMLLTNQESILNIP